MCCSTKFWNLTLSQGESFLVIPVPRDEEPEAVPGPVAVPAPRSAPVLSPEAVKTGVKVGAGLVAGYIIS